MTTIESPPQSATRHLAPRTTRRAGTQSTPRCRLARKPQTAHVGAQVLVHLQRRRGRPVGIAAVRPGLGAPTRIEEIDRLGDVVGLWEHLAQHGQHLGFRPLVRLLLHAVRFRVDDRDEEDVRPRQKSLRRERLPHRVVTPRRRRGVQQKLPVFRPEGLVELEEDLGVRAHLERGDRGAFPVGEFRAERDDVVLQHAQRESANRVRSADAVPVAVGDRHAVV